MKPHRRRLFLYAILALFVLWWGLGSVVSADWTLTSSAPSISLGHGATLVTKAISRAGGETCELTLVFFDETQCELQVASNTFKKEARSIQDIAVQSGAVAACNGGYFDPPKMLPSGLEIAAGVRTGTLDRALPFGGMLLIADGKSSLITTEEFSESAGIAGLIQCCPRLVEAGCEIEKLGGETPAERTFILTDGNGRWAIGISKQIPMQELAHILCNPKIISELKVQRALNLDGGPSTALWCRHADGGKTSAPEKWKVRNAILVLPRKQSE